MAGTEDTRAGAEPLALKTLGKHLTELGVGFPYRGCVEDFAKTTLISGWCFSTAHPVLGASLEFLLAGIPVGTTRTSASRRDVNAAVGETVPASFAFDLTTISAKAARDVLAALATSTSDADAKLSELLRVRVTGTELELPFSNALAAKKISGAELSRLLEAQAVVVPKVLGDATHIAARGSLEGVAACARTGEAIAWGWMLHAPDVAVAIVGESGDEHALDPIVRWYRRDVDEAAAHEIPEGSLQSGFVARLVGVIPGQHVRLVGRSAEGEKPLHSATVVPMPASPVGTARLLFSIASPMVDFHRRLALLDGPLLEARLVSAQRRWPELPVVVRQLGTPPRAPSVSVIVPLFGTAKFVEHQLMEFARDPSIAERVDLVYVVDDPTLVDAFTAEAEMLHRIYRLPFRWVFGGVNRGFAGANNLGAAHARSDRYIFLNSDAFPNHAGWIEALLAVLDERPDIGAVGPRLLFGDGSLQHAGMQFMRLEEFGIWVNHHPYSGLDPSLDPNRELTLVPAVTGACLAMRREDFEAVGGWDTGYLIGDFEDSDLCLKLRERGLATAYLPTVELTHLGRQSFKTLGQGEFRTRVVFLNAARHQRRWKSAIEAQGHVS